MVISGGGCLFTSPLLLRVHSSLVMINLHLFLSSPLTHRFPQTSVNAVLGYLTQWTLSAYVILCHLSPSDCPLFSTSSLCPLRTIPHHSSFPHPLLSFLIYLAAGCAGLCLIDRLFVWLNKWIFDWLMERLSSLHCHSFADSKLTTVITTQTHTHIQKHIVFITRILNIYIYFLVQSIYLGCLSS